MAVDKAQRVRIMRAMIKYLTCKIAPILIVSFALMLIGCANAKEQVTQSLTAAQADVATIKSLSKDNLLSASELPTTPVSAGIKTRSELQIKIADKLIGDLVCVSDIVETKLKNSHPIRDFFNRVGFILMVVVVVGACMYFGVGSIIRPIMNRVGLWIKPKIRQEAKADAAYVVKMGGIEHVEPNQVKRIATRQTGNDHAVAFKQEMIIKTGAIK